MSINPRLLADQAKARFISQLADVHLYEGEAVNVPLVAGGDGAVQQYVVLTVSTGRPTDEQDLAETVVDLDWAAQFTCGGPEVADVQQLAFRVHTAFYRWRPTLEGVSCGRLEPPPGYDPLIQMDRSVTPHRPFVPLLYRSVHTT